MAKERAKYPKQTKEKFADGDKKGRNESKAKGKGCEFSSKTGVPGHNDWSWYAPTETIAREIASIPFNCITGTKWLNSYSSASLSRNANVTGDFNYNMLTRGETSSGVANVLTFNYMLNYGDSDINSTNGINMAAKQLYTFIRKSNSGAKVYEAPDVMMYVCAMREIYALYFKLKKILGLVKFYSNVNRSVPAVLLRANGIKISEYNDIKSNYAQYRGALNLVAEKINSFAMPKYFKVFMRDAFLQSYIFSDSTSLSAQFYNFNLFAIRTWSATASEQGTSLVPVVVPRSFPAMLELLNSALNIMFDDTDVNTIAGDIMKAFGDSDLYRVLETDENYTCIPIYDEDILNQIQNAYYVGIANVVAADNYESVEGIIRNSFPIKQDANNNIVTYHTITLADLYTWAPVGSPNTMYSYDKLLFNSHKDSPEYTDVLEWSRLSQTYDFIEGEEGKLGAVSIKAGAELILGSSIFTTVGTTEDTVWEEAFSPNIASQAAYTIRQFDWHPTMYASSNNSLGFFTVYSGDVKKCTLISKDILMRMHDCALYSLFNAKSLDLLKK